MASREDMRTQFAEMGVHQVSRSIGSGLFNKDWEREAALWLGEREAEIDQERTAQTTRTIKLARSAAIAAWIAVLVSLIGAGISLAGLLG